MICIINDMYLPLSMIYNDLDLTFIDVHCGEEADLEEKMYKPLSNVLLLIFNELFIFYEPLNFKG